MESPTHHHDTIATDGPATSDSSPDATRSTGGSGIWPLLGIGVGALAAFILVGYGVWWLIAAAAKAIESLFTAATKASQPIAHTIADPVQRLINEQADQLPVNANTLWWALTATTVGLFILAVLGSAGARIGWAAIGVITTALVWIAHAPDTRVLAATITAGAWAVLAVLAFNRFTTPEPDPKVVVFRPDPSSDDDQAV